MKSLFWITSSLPTFTFMLYFALPLLQSSETMTMVLIEIFGTKRDFLYDAFVSVIGLMIHYSTGYDDAITWWMLLVVSVLSLSQTKQSVSAKQSAE